MKDCKNCTRHAAMSQGLTLKTLMFNASFDEHDTAREVSQQ
jgi:hypothetical protein